VPRSRVAVPNQPEPRWQVLIAVLAVGGLELALPPQLTVRPRWLFPALVGVLVLPLVFSHRTGRQRLNRILGVVVTTVVTVALIVSVVRLVTALPTGAEAPVALLFSAAELWLTNVLVFSLWYWRLDAGGPHRRDARGTHAEGSFLFPQLTLLPDVRQAFQPGPWRPQFMDYLFLAFNTSTAFSPTDTPVLTRWAKALMMVQSLISLAVLALLAARAVNIL
jgi:uncharacterized membrane protein